MVARLMRGPDKSRAALLISRLQAPLSASSRSFLVSTECDSTRGTESFARDTNAFCPESINMRRGPLMKVRKA